MTKFILETKELPRRNNQVWIANVTGELTRNLKLKDSVLRLLDCQRIPVLAESEDRLDVVIAIGALAPDMERQVQLGVSSLGVSAQGAAVAGVRPAAILRRIRAATSSSALISAALQAKRAS